MNRPGLSPLYSFVVVPVQTEIRLVASCSNSDCTPFCIPVLTPRRITKIKIPEDTDKAVRNVRSLFLLSVSKISCQRSKLNIQCTFGANLLHLFVFYNEPVFKVHYTLTHVGNIHFVGDTKYGFAFIINFLYQIHDLI